MPRRTKSAASEQKGVAEVQHTVACDLEWIFRGQPTDDYGIDAQIEVVDDEPSGRLLAVQIKCGPSYFAKPAPDGAGVVHYIDSDHREYWLAHSLPVIVVLVRPDGAAFWEHVTRRTVKRTPKGWKIVVPYSQPFDASAAERLRSIADVSPYRARLNKLVIERDLIQLVGRGTEARLEIAEWINKSSGRGSLRVFIQDAGSERTVYEIQDFISPGWNYERLARHLFPWADLSIDDDYYESFDEAQWNAECGAYDSETDEYIIHSEDFGEWREDLPAFRPYEIVSDEVAKYRLVVELNDLGRSFINVDRYLSADE